MTDVEKKDDKLKVITQKEVREAIEKNPDMKWFIVQTYSGKEAAAKRSIEESLKTKGSEHKVGIIVMGEKLVSKIRGDKRKTVKEKLYPSYLYVLVDVEAGSKLKMDGDAYYAINGASNVSRFVGTTKEGVPTAIQNKLEVEKMISQLQEGEEVGVSHSFEKDTPVKPKEGPFSEIKGYIDSVNEDKNEVNVRFEIIGSSTIIAFKYNQIEILVD